MKRYLFLILALILLVGCKYGELQVREATPEDIALSQASNEYAKKIVADRAKKDMELAEESEAIGVGLIKVVDDGGGGWVKQITFSAGTVAVSGSDATVTIAGVSPGSGSTTTVQEEDAAGGSSDADIVVIDFQEAFAVTEAPDTEVNIFLDVTPDSGNATLIVEEDSVQVKYDSTDFGEGTNGLYLGASPTLATSLAIGTDPADAGALRLPNAGYVYSEKAVTGTDISVIGVDASDIVQIGASGASGVTITPATTISGDLSLGAAAASTGAATGDLLMSNATGIYFEADAAGTDVAAIVVGSDEKVVIAGSGSAGVTITPALTLSSTFTDGTLTGDGTGGITGIVNLNSVIATELAELETIGATTISANQWAALGGIAETLGYAELDLLDGQTDLASQSELDTVAALVDTDDEIIAIINASPGTQISVAAGGTNSGTALNNNFVMVSNTGAIAESATVTVTELALLNGETDLASQSELDTVAALVDTDDEIIAIINASPGTQIVHEAGGLEADVNAYSGLVAIAGGSTAEVDAKSELETQIADVADFAEADGDVWTGTHDYGGATTLEIPNGTTDPTSTTGAIALDTDGDGGEFDGPVLAVSTSGATMGYFFSTTTFPGTAQDNYIIKYDAGADTLGWEADNSAGTTAFDDIADPDNDGTTTIDFDNAAEAIVYTIAYDTAGSFFTINNSDAALANNTYLLDLDYSVDDDEANADYIKLQDAGGVVLTIQEGGMLSIGANPGDGGIFNLDNAAVISWEDATETTLTHVDNTGLAINTNLEAATITEGGVAVHNNDQMDASSELLAIIDDETGSGVIVFGTTPTFTTSIVLTGADADPGAAGGTIVYDNAITDILDGGALRWNDTGAAGALGVRLLVDLDTDPSDDGFVVTYDATDDKFKMASAGAGDVLADASVPFTGDVAINSATPALTLTDTDSAAGTGVLSFQATDANDIVASLQTDIAGTPTTFIELDGVSETVDLLKNTVVTGTFSDGTATLNSGAWSAITTLATTGKISNIVTTEQLRLSYDASNYATWTVGANGDLTIATVDDAAGTAGNLTFSPDGTIILTPATDVVGALTAGSVASDGAVSGTTLALTSTLTGVTDITAGSATTDSGPLTMIQGNQTGDPQVILDLTADANGDFSITTDTGDLSLVSAATAIISAAGENIIITGTSNTLTTTTGTGVTSFDFGAIDVVANDLTMDGNLSIGSNPADSGTGIRMSNNTVIEFEDSENTGEVTALQVDSDEKITIGDANATGGVTIVPATTVSGLLTGSAGVSSTTITASAGFALGNTDYVGITSNERFTFATAGTIAAIGANFEIGATSADETEPHFAIIGDADSDAADTDETFKIDLTSNATPTSALWEITSTQSAGYTFDKEVTFKNNAAAATFGAVATNADVVVAFDAVTAQGSITYMEDEDRFDFDNNVSLLSDSAVLGFGADNDVTLTHTADTGLTLNLALTATDITVSDTLTVSTLTQSATATPTWTATDSSETADGTFDIKANATTADYAMLMRFYVDEGDGAGADGADDVLFMTLNGDGANTTASGTIEFERIGNFEMGLSSSNATNAGFIDLYEASGEGTDRIRLIAPALAADVTLTLPTTDGGENEILRTDGSGTLSWTSAGSATAWDDIPGPDNNATTTIAFDNAAEATTLTTVYDTAGSFFKIDNTEATIANNTYLLHLEYTDDGEANADFFKVSDNNGNVKLTIQEEGNLNTVGTVVATGGFFPQATSGAALGSNTLDFSDLWLADAAVIDFDSGDLTITHTAETLTVAGGDFVVETLNSITATEIAELATIGATVIEAADWTALAAMSGVNTGDNTVATAAASQVITDNAIVTVDSADAGTGEYARFTTDGILGLTPTEVVAELDDIAWTYGAVAVNLASATVTMPSSQSLTTPNIGAATGTSLDISGAAGLTLQNDETITNAVDDTFLFSREDAGTVIITAADDNANADLTVVAGGTGNLVLGDSSNATISLISDGVNISEAELIILDGVTATTTEINYLGSKTMGGNASVIITGTTGTNTYTAVWDASGNLVDGADPATYAPLASPTFTGVVSLPNNAAPTTDTVGDIAVDLAAWTTDAIEFFDGTQSTYLVGALASDAPSNGQHLVWNTGGTITWETLAGGGDFLADGSVPMTDELVMENSESLHTDSDAVFDFTRNDTGIVTITASDDDATAALTVVAGGAAKLTLGNATNTDISIVTDGVDISETELTYLDGVSSDIQTQLGTKAAVDSQTFTTDITIDGLALTADTITNDAALTVVAPTITLDADGTNDMDVILKVDNGGVDWAVTIDGSEATVVIGDGDAQDHIIKIDANTSDGNITFDESVGKFEFDQAILAPINQVAKSSAYTVGTDNAEEAYGSMIYNTGAVKYTLPSGVAGMNLCIQQVQGQTGAITVAVPSGDYLVYEGARGTQEAGGDEADLSASGATAKICLMAYDATDWYVVSSVGTWAE